MKEYIYPLLKFICICSLILITFNSSFSVSSAQGQERIQFKTTKVTENIYMFTAGPSNFVISAGDDGVMLIDSPDRKLVAQLKASIRKVSTGSIKYLLNTHDHIDHIDGNEDIAADGAIIIAHKNISKRMAESSYSEKALPSITFSNDMTFRFNGDNVHMFYFGNAHTDGDAVIYFRKDNVIHMGDVFLYGGAPGPDLNKNGSIDGLINYLDYVLDMINNNTVVIPSHGHLFKKEDLQDHRDMLFIMRNRIRNFIKEGKTLEEVIAAKPAEDFSKKYSNPRLSDWFVGAIYKSLIRQKKN